MASPAIGHLRIQILGPPAAWSVSGDGVWHRLKMPDQRGWTTWGLLATAIFIPPEERTLRELASWLYDSGPEGEEKVLGNARKVWDRTRKALGTHAEVLPSGSDYYLAGRDDRTGPRRVIIDWDDVRRYQREERFKEALALLSRGLPLPGFPDNEAHLSALLEEIRPVVHSMITKCLEGADDPVGDVLSWAQIGSYSSHLPEEWTPLLEPRAPRPSPVESTASRERDRIPPPPRLFGAFTEDDLFEPCRDGHVRLARELEEVAADGGDVWWGSHQWLGAYIALWHRTLPTPCETIAFRYIDDVYDAARFGLTDIDAPKEKATLIEAPKQLGDNDHKQIICGKTNWGLAQEWARLNADELFADPMNLSVFGVRGRPVYPNILAVHTLVQTSDRFLLFALRSSDVDFYKLTWSASCEEGVSVGAREFTGPPTTGDQTILHAIQGCLFEEWGIEEDAIRDSSCLAIGREWASEAHETDTTLYLSPAIIAACRLTISLDEVWARLNEVPRIRDRDEHRIWAGCRFATRDALLRFVAATKDRRENRNLLQELYNTVDGIELRTYPGSAKHLHDRGMMPTSQARLVLGSAWIAYQEGIDKTIT